MNRPNAPSPFLDGADTLAPDPDHFSVVVGVVRVFFLNTPRSIVVLATGAAMGRLVGAILADHYGLPVPPTKDRRGVAQPRDASGRFDNRTKEE